MNIGIIGTKDFNDYKLLKTVIYENVNVPNITHIIFGGETGIDNLAKKFALENNIKTLIFKPDWNKYEKSAIFKKNITIIENSDIIFVFWNGKNRNSIHDIKIAKNMNKPLIIIHYYEKNIIEKINIENIKNK